MALRSTTTILSVAIVLTTPAGLTSAIGSTPPADDGLAELVIEYEAAKKEWQEWKRNQGRQGRGRGGFGPGGGRGGRGGFGRRNEAPALLPILERIANVNSAASLGYLAREYQDPEPEIAAMCAVAILASDDENRAKIVIRGFDARGKWTLGAKARVLDALTRTEAKGGLDFVVKLASKGKLEARTLALGSLHLRPNNDEVLTLLLRSLEDRAPPVRKAALRALSAFRERTVIDSLVDHLEEEREEQLRIDTLRLLVKLTGQNFGLEVGDWQKWWETAATTFDFNARRDGKTVVVTPDLQYFGIEVASKRVSFLVDASFSMERDGGPGGGRGGRGGRGRGGGGGDGGGGDAGGKAKIDLLKDELSRILKELPDDTYVNIIAFHQTPVPWQKELQSLKGRGRDAAVRFVRELTTGFGTNIYDTLELALNDTRVDTIFLLSDGQPYGGKFTSREDILREIGAINRVRGARIHCLGFGNDTQLLRDLAEENGGDFRQIDG